MKKLLAVIGVLVLVGLGVFSWVTSTYNDLVELDVQIDESWGQVNVSYERRFDLIPNLVQTVRGVADFEQDTYIAVTEARSAWVDANSEGSRSEQIAATGVVESALSRLLVTVENYPQLQASESFQTLQAQLEGTENRVATARRDYNATVSPYNSRVRSFPTLLIAGYFGFEPVAFFEASEGADDAPRVDFDS